ncbi:hypothetical protein PGQ11_012114 [Apiospora arundinis]|uniref:Uncharacterized protein n=1 Tax=Apiospora arundinis TaxID=335852 RepID=A0ABR2I2E8_9PEZI
METGRSHGISNVYDNPETRICDVLFPLSYEAIRGEDECAAEAWPNIHDHLWRYKPDQHNPSISST